MKHLTLLVLLISASPVLAADYTRINIPTTSTINKIFFYNDQMGWAVTSGGELFTTYDGGKMWKKSQVTKRSITDIHFHNRLGYIVGERGLVMKSTNGGGTWQDDSQNIKFNFTGVGIVNDSAIIICGTDQNSLAKTRGVVFQSFDYGKTWRKHPWKLGNGYTDMAVFGGRKVYLLAIKKVFHSISSGARYFHGKYEGTRMGLGFDFIDDWGYMVGHKGYFAHSATHGRLWDEIDLNIDRDLYAVDMFDRYSGVAVGEDALVVYFYDDGKRHIAETCGEKVDLRTVCVTGQKIFIGGDDGVLLYTDRVSGGDK